MSVECHLGTSYVKALCLLATFEAFSFIICPDPNRIGSMRKHDFGSVSNRSTRSKARKPRGLSRPGRVRVGRDTITHVPHGRSEQLPQLMQQLGVRASGAPWLFVLRRL